MSRDSNTSHTRNVAVLYDAQDAFRYLAESPAGVEMVLPLTPAAQSILAGQSVEVLDPLKQHTTYSHARDIIRGERLMKYLEKRFGELPLNQASRHTLVEDMVRGCHVSSRLWTTLRGSYTWILPVEEGWYTAATREEAHCMLLNRLMTSYGTLKEAQGLEASSFLSCKMLHWLNLLLMRLIARERPVFLFKFKRGFADLMGEIHRQNPRQWCVAPRFWDGKPDAVDAVYKLVRQLLSGKAPEDRSLYLTVPARKMPGVERTLETLIEGIPDSLAKTGARVIQPRLLASVHFSESMPVFLEQYLRASNARTVLNFDENLLLSTVLAYSAKQAQVPSLLACHTSVTPAPDPTAARAKSHRTSHLTASPLCDVALVQTPSAEAALKQFTPFYLNIPGVRIKPFVWGLQALGTEPVPKRPDEERIILHASNYFEWARYEPWVYETSLEFVHNLKVLIEAVNQMRNTRLIIRIKPNFGTKGEFTPETLDKLLPPGKWEIRSGGSIHADMARADLIVASHSTSIEEGFMIGKPALLISDRFRYQHVSAQQTAPAGGQRHTAYCPKDETVLGPMLQAILDSHASPLSWAELADRLWDNQVSEMKSLAGLLSGPPLSRQEFLERLIRLSPERAAEEELTAKCMEGVK